MQVRKELGQFAGVGFSFERDDKQSLLRVTAVVLNGPAHQAGVRADDFIVDIADLGGQPALTKDLSDDEAVYTLLGPPGTKLDIKVVKLQ